MSSRKAVVAFGLLLVLATLAPAQQARALEVPYLAGRVNDLAGLLSAQTEEVRRTPMPG